MIVTRRDDLGRTEAFRGSRACFRRFDCSIARRRVGHKRFEQMVCGVSDIIDRAIESCLVCLGRFRETAQLPDELKRRSVNFIRRRRWAEIMKCFDGSAHVRPSAIVDQRSTQLFIDRKSCGRRGLLSLRVTQNYIELVWITRRNEGLQTL
jgi:hypothetical protein